MGHILIFKIKFNDLQKLEEFIHAIKEANIKVMVRNENGLSLEADRISNLIYMMNFSTINCHVDFNEDYSTDKEERLKRIIENLGLKAP